MTDDARPPQGDPLADLSPPKNADPNAPPAIGIDLGTTNSLIACWREGKAQLIPNAHGQVLTPSAVSLDEQGSVLIGRAAWERRLTHPQMTAVAFKRDMGTRKHARLGTRQFLPEELSALVLTSLKQDAEAHLGQPVKEVVISVPAYFNDMQRKATKAAAELAGLQVTRLINEPTAAALAFGLQEVPEDNAYLVFDLGGGTFDVSIVDQFEGVIEIKASTGDNYLGGEDFTSVMLDLLLEQLPLPQLQAKAENTREKLLALARLRGIAERMKCEMTQQQEVRADFSFEDKAWPLAITETRYDAACQTLIERLRTPIERAIRDARLKPADLAQVVLVGGATCMPMVRKLATRLFGRFPNTSVDPDQAIAIGAATQAALTARNAALDEVLLTDVCPYSLGLAVSEEGAGGQVVHGLFSPIIERNVIVPTSRVRSYYTMSDNQTELELEIYQGERRFCRDNIELGRLSVAVPPRKRGEVSIDVRFTYDVSGLLDIDVTVPESGQTFSKSLLGSGAALSPEEIETRRKTLNELKIHPREDLPNRASLARADRLYAELTGAARESVGQALTRFSVLLESQDPVEIQRGRLQLEKWLDELEGSL